MTQSDLPSKNNTWASDLTFRALFSICTVERTDLGPGPFDGTLAVSVLAGAGSGTDKERVRQELRRAVESLL